ncbi:hypothetical protein NDU88_000730 [Pleurodeles waltl]|uniref:Uncharacterized protein n=1 Tax=Pleurodeles waltl TaxID=8319 RepID=A0AAV7SAH4_PLEWA|nr:hypothetical protein NDU88_000730 [Pleurodeles waltl]
MGTLEKVPTPRYHFKGQHDILNRGNIFYLLKYIPSLANIRFDDLTWLRFQKLPGETHGESTLVGLCQQPDQIAMSKEVSLFAECWTDTKQKQPEKYPHVLQAPSPKKSAYSVLGRTNSTEYAIKYQAELK